MMHIDRFLRLVALFYFHLIITLFFKVLNFPALFAWLLGYIEILKKYWELKKAAAK